MDSKDFEFKQKLVDSCPRKVFSINPETNRVTIVNESACMSCGDCEAFNTSYADKIVTISQQPNVFKFVVEGTGALPPLEILKKALEVLEMKLNRIKHGLQEIMLSTVWLVCCNQHENW